MKRWLKRIGIGLFGLLVLAVLIGSGYEMLTRSRMARRYPVQGRLIDVGGRRIQLDCRGSGTPVVVFEAGLDTFGSLSWAPVHDSVASTTRACAYSRAGVMWSDPAAGPHNGVTVARDLHATLAGAGEPAPFVLVGHSLGGPYIMTYTKHYPAEVAGLVFVDASHPDQVGRIRQAIGKDLDPAMGVLKVVAALAWTGLARLQTAEAGPPSTPAEAAAAMRAYQPTSLGSAVSEWESLGVTLAEAGTFRQLADRPLVVLTAMAPMRPEVMQAVDITVEQSRRMQETWQALHDDEATWSTRSRHEIVPDATHYIQFDRPEVVIRGVREVVGAVRSSDRASDVR